MDFGSRTGTQGTVFDGGARRNSSSGSGSEAASRKKIDFDEPFVTPGGDSSGDELFPKKKSKSSGKAYLDWGTPLVDVSGSRSHRTDRCRLALKQTAQSLVTRFGLREDRKATDFDRLKKEADELAQTAAHRELQEEVKRRLKETCIELLRKEKERLPDAERWAALVEKAVNHPLSALHARANEIERQSILKSEKGTDAESKGQEEQLEILFKQYTKVNLKTREAYQDVLNTELNKAFVIRSAAETEKLETIKPDEMFGTVDKLEIDKTIQQLASIKDIGSLGNVLVETAEVTRILSDPIGALLDKDPVVRDEAAALLTELAAKGVAIFDKRERTRIGQLLRGGRLPPGVVRTFERLGDECQRAGRHISKKALLHYFQTIAKRCIAVIDEVKLHEGISRERLEKVNEALAGLVEPQLALTTARLRSRLSALAKEEAKAKAKAKAEAQATDKNAMSHVEEGAEAKIAEEAGAAAEEVVIQINAAEEAQVEKPLSREVRLRNRLLKPEENPDGAFSMMELVNCLKNETRRHALLELLPEDSEIRGAAENLFKQIPTYYTKAAQIIHVELAREESGQGEFHEAHVLKKPAMESLAKNFGHDLVHGAATEALLTKREERARCQTELDAAKDKLGAEHSTIRKDRQPTGEPIDDSNAEIELREVVSRDDAEADLKARVAETAARLEVLDKQVAHLEKLTLLAHIRVIAHAKNLKLMETWGDWLAPGGFWPAMLGTAVRDGGATYLGKLAGAGAVYGFTAMGAATGSAMAGAAVPTVLTIAGIYLALKRLSGLEGKSKFEHTPSRLYQFARVNAQFNMAVLGIAALTGTGAAVAAKFTAAEAAKHVEKIAAYVINASFEQNLGRPVRQAVQSFFDQFFPGLTAMSAGLTLTPIYGVGMTKAHQVEINSWRDVVYMFVAAGVSGGGGQPHLQPEGWSFGVPVWGATSGVEAGDAAFPDMVKLCFWLTHQDEYILSREDKSGSWGKPDKDGKYTRSTGEAVEALGKHIFDQAAGRVVFGAPNDTAAMFNGGFKGADANGASQEGWDFTARQITPPISGGLTGLFCGPRARTLGELTGTESAYKTSTGAMGTLAANIAKIAPSVRAARKKKALNKQASSRAAVVRLKTNRPDEKRRLDDMARKTLTYLRELTPNHKAHEFVCGVDEVFVRTLSSDAQALLGICIESVNQRLEAAILGLGSFYDNKDVQGMVTASLSQAFDVPNSPFFQQPDKLKLAQHELANALSDRERSLARTSTLGGQEKRRLGGFWSAFAKMDVVAEHSMPPSLDKQQSALSRTRTRSSVRGSGRHKPVSMPASTSPSRPFSIRITPEVVVGITDNPSLKVPNAWILSQKLLHEPEAMMLLQRLAEGVDALPPDTSIDDVMARVLPSFQNPERLDDAVKKLLSAVATKKDKLDPQAHGQVWHDLKRWSDPPATPRSIPLPPPGLHVPGEISRVRAASAPGREPKPFSGSMSLADSGADQGASALETSNPPAPSYVPAEPLLETTELPKQKPLSPFFRTRSGSQSGGRAVRPSSIIRSGTDRGASIENKEPLNRIVSFHVDNAPELKPGKSRFVGQSQTDVRPPIGKTGVNQILRSRADSAPDMTKTESPPIARTEEPLIAAQLIVEEKKLDPISPLVESGTDKESSVSPSPSVDLQIQLGPSDPQSALPQAPPERPATPPAKINDM